MTILRKQSAATAALMTAALLVVAVSVNAKPSSGPPGKQQAPKAPAGPKARTAPATIGIADQHGATFTSPLFAALGVRHVRLNLAWDALSSDWQVAELDDWMAQAQAAGVEPLVIFSQSRLPGRTRLLPSTAQFAAVVDQLRARYPFVREFAAWNEANHTGQPTYRRPDAVAAYYKVLVTRCPGCKVLPASLLDNKNLVPWTTKLRKAIRRLRLPEPRLWGLHNYSDVNMLRDRATRQVASALKGRIWITESGGVVEATSPTASRFPQGESYAARVTRYILGPMLRRNPRVERVYFYQWRAHAEAVSWDSALVDATGAPRPAYQVIAGHMAAARLAAARAQPGAAG
jgi:hypothetical protein